MLELYIGYQTITQHCDEKNVSKVMKKWLFKVRRFNTHKYVVMEFFGKDVSELDKEYCHRGALSVSHHGMDTAKKCCNREFWGITRILSRLFVARCHDCQQMQPKQHKAKLVPISRHRHRSNTSRPQERSVPLHSQQPAPPQHRRAASLLVALCRSLVTSPASTKWYTVSQRPTQRRVRLDVAGWRSTVTTLIWCWRTGESGS